MSFFDYLKNAFLVLIFLQFTPSLLDNLRKQYNKYIKPKTSVGLISIQGVITDSSPYIKHINGFFQDPDIKALLLKIDSPGGAAASSQAIHQEILLLKKDFHKPVIVLVENTCASGGYYIAAAADYIIAPGTSLIGSIGAYLPYYFHFKEFIEQFKISSTSVKAGTYKSLGDPFVPATPQGIALLQGVLDDTYQQFASDIAATRNLSMNTIAVWADGKVFSGRQALQLGLIDELGSWYAAIKVIKEKALIEGDIEWIKPPQPNSWSTLFGLNQDDESPSTLSHITNSICSCIETRYANTHIQ